MKKIKIVRVALLSALLVMVNSCGSSSSKDDDLKEVTPLQVEIDREAPVITIKGDSSVDVMEGKSFQDLGATALDKVDGEVAVIRSGIINTAKVGDYTIEYRAVDSSGNEAMLARVIHVIAPLKVADTTTTEIDTQKDTHAPIITLQGDNPMQVTQSSDFEDPGARAIDNVDGEVVVKSSGIINTFELGNHTIVYSAIDSSGNEANITRDINVTALPSPEVTMTKRYYLTPAPHQSYLLSDVDLASGQVSMGISDIPANQRGLRLSRSYNSHDKMDKTVGTFEINYGSRIDAKQTESIKSNRYLTPQDACEQGWRSIASRLFLDKKSNIKPLYRAKTTLCDIYDDTELKISLLTKRINDNPSNPHTKVHTLNRADGQTYIFYKKDNKWITTDNAPFKIERINEHFIVTTLSGVMEEYNHYGRLVSLTQKNQRIKLIYNEMQKLVSIEDAFKETITLEYNEEGLLIAVKSYDDSRVTYEYNSKQQLINVVYPDKSTKSYAYGNAYLERMVNADGVTIKTFLYDNQGRVMETKGVNGLNEMRFTYSNAATKVTQTTGEHLYRFKLLNSKLLTTSITTDEGVSTMRYDKNGYLVSSTNPCGAMAETSYSGEGLLLKKITDANNMVVSYAHNSFGRITQTLEAGVKTSYGYNSYGELIEKIVNANGVEAQTTRYEYNYRGQNTRTIYPNGAIVDNGYDKNGDRNRTIDALGFITTITSHDNAGRPLAITDINEINSTMTYDVMGRVLSVTDDTQTTKYQYDINGRETKISYPNGLITQKVYDARGNILIAQNNKKEKRVHLYDENNNLIKIERFKNDVLIRKSEMEYDPINRVIAQIDGEGNRTTYEYDCQNRLIVEIRSNESEEELDITYTYDIANRVLTSTHADDSTLDERYEYDQGEHSNGKLTKIINALGEIEFTYNIHGNMMSKTEMIDDNNFTIEFTYDDKNQLESKTYPSGKVIKYTYLKDEVTDITVNNSVLIKDIKRNQNGLLGYTYADGKTDEREYDLTGQLIKSITYDADGEIVDTNETNETTQSEEVFYSIYEGALLLGEYDERGDAINEYIYDGTVEIEKI